MITIKLIGGLGNQMFQYACARRLALKRGVKLKFDLTFLLHRLPRNNFTFRNYELGVFNIEESFTFLSKIAFYFNNLAFIASFIKSRLIKFFYPGYRVEEVDPRYFESRILDLGKDVYLSGQWAHEKYFFDIKEVIRQDFTFKNPLDEKNKELADMINSTNSISLHIRRGDCVGSEIDEKRNLCYYQEACDYILKNISNPVFFIFSDDSNWVKKNLKISAKYIVVDCNKGRDSYLDMKLMSLCKHNIMANSTFSWWGAWLNANQQKIVVAPKQWNNLQKYNDEIFTNSWIEF